MVKKTDEQFRKEVAQIFGDKIEILTPYTGNKAKVLVRHTDCGHEEYKAPVKILVGQGCGICRGKAISKAKTKSTEQYKKDLIENGIDYIDVIGEYTGGKNKIRVLNRKCGHEYEAKAGNILKGSGCPICYGHKDSKIFMDILNKRYPGEYNLLSEYKNGLSPITVKHKCGTVFKTTPKYMLKHHVCPRCYASQGEAFICDFLNKNNIQYEREYRFNDCKDVAILPFDFAIKGPNSLKMIEFDGCQHFDNYEGFFNSPKTRLHDEMKDRYCKENGIPLLRIPYWWLGTDRITKELEKFIL